MTLPKINTEALTALNAPVLDKEIFDIIRTLPAHKSPVTDGFLSEYYKEFSQILVTHLRALFNKEALSASFPEEMLQATIIALPKPRKKPDRPQNVRTISLLNTNLQIYAKILGNRLAKITPLVKADHVGFVKGR